MCQLSSVGDCCAALYECLVHVTEAEQDDTQKCPGKYLRINSGVTDKRGAGAMVVTFDESIADAAAGSDLLELDAALEELARLSPRQALLVESRFFGGLDVAEAAELIGVSEATALRDWRAAKAWLARELRAH